MNSYWDYMKSVNCKPGPSVDYQIFPRTRNFQHWLMFQGIELLQILQRPATSERFTINPMARQKFTGGAEFITFRLPRDEAENFDQWWAKSYDKFPAMLTDVINQGYKVSITPDFNNACVICSIVGKDPGNDNKGKCFTSRADEWSEALGLMLYKHLVIAGGEEWPEDAKGNNWG